MILRSRKFMPSGEVTGALLEGAVKEHLAQSDRYKRLREYYLGSTDVLHRRRAPGLPNNRLSHAFARYIVTVTAGYLVGSGIGYRSEEGSEEALRQVLDAYRAGDIPSVDIENARNAAIYGKGVEYICPGEDGAPVAYALSPESAFVVYEDDVRHKPLFGVCLTRETDIDGRQNALKALCVTDRSVSFFTQTREGFVLTRRDPHFFSGVPMVEYWNDENEKGDFEWVMSLIDAYDALQSDRLNDKDQFADKLLVLTGCTLETDENGRPPWLQLREDKALCLPDGEAKAGYLSGEMDENGNEILRKSLAQDIHKLSLVPDLSDVSFAGNVSGVAMKYKLMGLEQLTSMKQRWFNEGLKTRLKLFTDYLALRGGKKLSVSGVTAVFTRALPESLSETASVVKTAREAGAISTRTMVEMLHQGADWDEEMIKKEAEEAKKESAS